MSPYLVDEDSCRQWVIFRKKPFCQKTSIHMVGRRWKKFAYGWHRGFHVSKSQVGPAKITSNQDMRCPSLLAALPHMPSQSLVLVILEELYQLTHDLIVQAFIGQLTLEHGFELILQAAPFHQHAFQLSLIRNTMQEGGLFIDVVEEGHEMVVIALGKRIVGVVVTLGTTHGDSQPCGAYHVDSIDDSLDPIFLSIDPTL